MHSSTDTDTLCPSMPSRQASHERSLAKSSKWPAAMLKSHETSTMDNMNQPRLPEDHTLRPHDNSITSNDGGFAQDIEIAEAHEEAIFFHNDESTAVTTPTYAAFHYEQHLPNHLSIAPKTPSEQGLAHLSYDNVWKVGFNPKIMKMQDAADSTKRELNYVKEQYAKLFSTYNTLNKTHQRLNIAWERIVGEQRVTKNTLTETQREKKALLKRLQKTEKELSNSRLSERVATATSRRKTDELNHLVFQIESQAQKQASTSRPGSSQDSPIEIFESLPTIAHQSLGQGDGQTFNATYQQPQAPSNNVEIPDFNETLDLLDFPTFDGTMETSEFATNFDEVIGDPMIDFNDMNDVDWSQLLEDFNFPNDPIFPAMPAGEHGHGAMEGC